MSSTARGGVRSELDFYETQVEDSRPEIERLVPQFGPKPRILEAMAGRGAIVRELRRAWPLAHIEAIEIESGRAALLEEAGADVSRCLDLFQAPHDVLTGFDLVFTNPAFFCAQSMVELMTPLAASVVILQRINFLASIERAVFWDTHPANFRMLRRRPSFAASLSCGRKRGKAKDPCGFKRVQFLDAARPKRCPDCQATLIVSTSDSCEYAWYHFFEGSLRQYGHVGDIPAATRLLLKDPTRQGVLFA